MIAPNEDLRWIVGFEEAYAVCRDGRVFNRSGREMATRVDRYGYREVRLEKDGRQKHLRVHRLVCEAFHGPPTAEHCAHADGDKLNNAANNLRWATRRENVADSVRHGTFVRPAPAGELHGCAKLTADQVRALRALKGAASQREIATQFGISQTQVCHILQGKKWGRV